MLTALLTPQRQHDFCLNEPSLVICGMQKHCFCGDSSSVAPWKAIIPHILFMLTSGNEREEKQCMQCPAGPLQDPWSSSNPILCTTVLNGLSNCCISGAHMATGITENTCSVALARDTSSFYGGWLLTQSPLSDCASLFSHGPSQVSVRQADQSAQVEMTNSANFPLF